MLLIVDVVDLLRVLIILLIVTTNEVRQRAASFISRRRPRRD